MKVRIELEFEDSVSDFKIHDVTTRKEYYEKYHNERGVLFDDEAEAIYYDVDLPCIPIEGQRLGTRWGTCIVKWACWELEELEGDCFFDKTRVVVREE
jgi:hypothetical protein